MFSPVNRNNKNRLFYVIYLIKCNFLYILPTLAITSSPRRDNDHRRNGIGTIKPEDYQVPAVSGLAETAIKIGNDLTTGSCKKPRGPVNGLHGVTGNHGGESLRARAIDEVPAERSGKETREESLIFTCWRFLVLALSFLPFLIVFYSRAQPTKRLHFSVSLQSILFFVSFFYPPAKHFLFLFYRSPLHDSLDISFREDRRRGRS